MAGLDPGRMARLPDTRGMKNEIIMVRSQRNFYDHAVRASGAIIVEVGLPDRFAGAGVRDAEIWEIEDAINERTAAIFYVADAMAQPRLSDVTRLARARGIPVIVDAAAQLPPQANLKRFVEDGADLVAFSGGKLIGGPQASGFLCGRRDLIMSAALQHLDLDIHADMWTPPETLIDKHRLKGTPQHGIGRTCKAGKEEIIGLLTALRLFVAEGDAARHGRWLKRLQMIRDGLSGNRRIRIAIEHEHDTVAIPLLVIQAGDGAFDPAWLIARLIDGNPSIHADPARRDRGQVIICPVTFADTDAPVIAAALKRVLAE
jgi:L-seryl-tRNA(Ser) seleniumtransferase